VVRSFRIRNSDADDGIHASLVEKQRIRRIISGRARDERATSSVCRIPRLHPYSRGSTSALSGRRGRHYTLLTRRVTRHFPRPSVLLAARARVRRELRHILHAHIAVNSPRMISSRPVSEAAERASAEVSQLIDARGTMKSRRIIARLNFEKSSEADQQARQGLHVTLRLIALRHGTPYRIYNPRAICDNYFSSHRVWFHY